MGKGTRRFLFVGNHPCLDFVNTQMIVNGEPADLLESFEDLASWLVQARILTKSQADVVRAELRQDQMSSLLEQAKSFRATVRDLAERIATGRIIPNSTITAVNRSLSNRSGYPQIVRRKGGFEQRFHATATSAQTVLASLAEAVSDLLWRADFALVKKCGNPDCILYFYDTTKNHTRNWCSMQICGNRTKVAAYYARKRGQSGP